MEWLEQHQEADGIIRRPAAASLPVAWMVEVRALARHVHYIDQEGGAAIERRRTGRAAKNLLIIHHRHVIIGVRDLARQESAES